MSTPAPRVQDLLAAAKKASGRSIRDIAELSGLGTGTVSNYLNGVHRKNPIDDETLDKLSRGFGIPMPRLRAAHLAERGLTDADRDLPDVDVVSAILADPDLLPEAKEHLVRQYGLLLRVAAAGDPVSAYQARVEAEARKLDEESSNITDLSQGTSKRQTKRP